MAAPREIPNVTILLELKPRQGQEGFTIVGVRPTDSARSSVRRKLADIAAETPSGEVVQILEVNPRMWEITGEKKPVETGELAIEGMGSAH